MVVDVLATLMFCIVCCLNGTQKPIARRLVLLFTLVERKTPALRQLTLHADEERMCVCFFVGNMTREIGPSACLQGNEDRGDKLHTVQTGSLEGLPVSLSRRYDC